MMHASEVCAKQRRDGRARGTALLETAIVLPLLMLLLFGLLEYGWMFLKTQDATGIARHGARLAIRPDMSETQAMDRMQAMLEEAGLGDAVETCNVTADNDAEPPEVTARVYINYREIRLLGGFIPVPETVGGSVTMAMEGPGT